MCARVTVQVQMMWPCSQHLHWVTVRIISLTVKCTSPVYSQSLGNASECFKISTQNMTVTFCSPLKRGQNAAKDLVPSSTAWFFQNKRLAESCADLDRKNLCASNLGLKTITQLSVCADSYVQTCSSLTLVFKLYINTLKRALFCRKTVLYVPLFTHVLLGLFLHRSSSAPACLWQLRPSARGYLIRPSYLTGPSSDLGSGDRELQEVWAQSPKTGQADVCVAHMLPVTQKVPTLPSTQSCRGWPTSWALRRASCMAGSWGGSCSTLLSCCMLCSRYRSPGGPAWSQLSSTVGKKKKENLGGKQSYLRFKYYCFQSNIEAISPLRSGSLSLKVNGVTRKRTSAMCSHCLNTFTVQVPGRRGRCSGGLNCVYSASRSTVMS